MLCKDVAFERSEEVCVAVGVGRFLAVGSGGMTECHCDAGVKMSSVGDLGLICFEGEPSDSSASLGPFLKGLEPLLEGFFSLGFDFMAGRGARSSSAFFVEEPTCRSFKNAVTSAARVGYSNRPEDEKLSQR